jgi:hypothetical protein
VRCRLCCLPSARSGATAMKQVPFRPLVLQPCDMFPHTDHTELVALFERAPLAYGKLVQFVKIENDFLDAKDEDDDNDDGGESGDEREE